jgi:NAD(P)H-flavin reductase
MASEVEAAIFPGNPMVPRLFRVEHVRPETYDTFTLELAPEEGAEPFLFAPGQFNMLYVFGVGEVPISVSGDPWQPKTLVHTTRAVGAVTMALRKLKRSDTVGVRGPFGAGWPVEEAAGSDVVLVAGGIGLAPLRPAMYRILASRERYGNVALLYGTRTPQDILFRRELERWRARLDVDVHVTVDRASGRWSGRVGVVTTTIQRAGFDPANTVALVCGPEVMMRFTALELRKRGVAESNIHLSMERNMKCAIGFCGHCQLGPNFICKDGPVFRWDRVKSWMGMREA